MEKQKRLEYLKNQKVLTNDEMSEFMNLDPEYFISIPATMLDLAVKNPSVAMENFEIVNSHIKISKENGFYIEYISLRLLKLDFLIRLYLAVIDKKDMSSKECLQFGYLIKEVEKTFESSLIARLKEFNSIRKLIIHRLFQGEVKFTELKNSTVIDEDLEKDILEYIVKISRKL